MNFASKRCQESIEEDLGALNQIQLKHYLSNIDLYLHESSTPTRRQDHLDT